MVRGGSSHRQVCGFPAEDFMTKKDFNDFRFSGLDWKKTSNKYMTVNYHAPKGTWLAMQATS